jgi:hypothetical protein
MAVFKSKSKLVAHDPRTAPVMPKGVNVTTGAAADRTMQNMIRQTKSGKGTLTFTPKGKGK